MPRLILNPGAEGSQAFELQPGSYEIGRHPDNAICIPDGSVSTLHCKLTIDGNAGIVTDMNSTNGTFVDGRQITESPLQNSQRLRLGAIDLLFESDGIPTPSSDPTEAPRLKLHLAAEPPIAQTGQTTLVEQASHSDPGPSMAVSPPPLGEVAMGKPSGTSKKGRKRSKQKKRDYGEPNVGMGLLGAAAGALVGMLLWYGTIKLTGFEVGIIAWAVGVAVGFGCRILGGGYSRLLGFAAAVFTFIAIILGQYLAGRAAVHDFFEETAAEYYEEELALAKEVVSIQSDEELRAYIVDETLFDPADDGVLTDAEFHQWRAEELPKLQALANGTTTREQFAEQMEEEFFAVGMAFLILKESVNLWTLLWLFLGVGSAWRLGIGEDVD